MYIKTFENYTINKIWYRGYTTNTKRNIYSWLTSDKKHAEQYSELNKLIYGGESIIDEVDFNENNFNIIDLTMYDMDDMVDENEIDDFLVDVKCDFHDYTNLFDDIEDEIPLSRLVNSIIDIIFEKTKCDGFKINESDIITIIIKTTLI